MRTKFPVNAFGAALLALSLAGCTTPPVPRSGPWLDFAAMQQGTSSNSALACAADLCPGVTISRSEFSFNASAERVAEALRGLEPTAQFRAEPSGDIRARYIAITPLMRFRDDVDVLIQTVSAEQSRMAVYSVSRVGVSDFGTNAARIATLEQRLRAALSR